MDCRTARLLIDFSRPQIPELEGAEAEALQTHLADCPECGALAHAERQADHQIGLAMRAVPVPEGLRERLLAQVQQQRRLTNRRWWVGRIALLAAAACILLAVALALTWRAAQRPVPDPDQLAARMYDVVVNPTPDSVQDWFKAREVPTVAPRDFNYRFLADYRLEEYQGKEVPVLLFVRGKEQARVYILSARQFDWDQLKATLTGGSGGIKWELKVNSKDPRIAYLSFYTGESLQPFLANGQAPSV